MPPHSLGSNFQTNYFRTAQEKSCLLELNWCHAFIPTLHVLEPLYLSWLVLRILCRSLYNLEESQLLSLAKCKKSKVFYRNFSCHPSKYISRWFWGRGSYHHGWIKHQRKSHLLRLYNKSILLSCQAGSISIWFCRFNTRSFHRRLNSTYYLTLPPFCRKSQLLGSDLNWFLHSLNFDSTRACFHSQY